MSMKKLHEIKNDSETIEKIVSFFDKDGKLTSVSGENDYSTAIYFEIFDGDYPQYFSLGLYNDGEIIVQSKVKGSNWENEFFNTFGLVRLLNSLGYDAD